MRLVKILERRTHRRESFKSANLRSEIVGLPNSRKERKTKPYNRSGAPAETPWELAKDVYNLEKSRKTHSAFLPKLGQCWHPLWQSRKRDISWSTLELSVHMLSKKDLSSGDLETLKRSRSSVTGMTANGEVQTNEEAQVYVHDLHIFVTVQLLEDTLAVLSLDKQCKEHSYTCEWPSGSEPRLNKNENQTFCRTENFVPVVVPGLSSSSGTTSFSTSPPQDLSISLEPANTRSNEEAAWDCSKGVAGNCNGEGIPEWLEDLTENLEIAEVPATADISHDTDPKCPTKVASWKHRIFTHSPKLRGLQANQDYEGSLQKTHWRSSTLAVNLETITDTRSWYKI